VVTKFDCFIIVTFNCQTSIALDVEKAYENLVAQFAISYFKTIALSDFQVLECFQK
jgi:hypothetical protein